MPIRLKYAKERLLSYLLVPIPLIALARAIFRSKLKGRRLTSVTLIEHLGDIVACEPVAKKLSKESYVVWFVKGSYAPIVQSNPHIDSVVIVRNLHQWSILRAFARLFGDIVDLHIDGRVCTATGYVLATAGDKTVSLMNYYQHGTLLYSFSKAAGLQIDDAHPTLWIKSDLNLEKFPYVVFHCQSNEHSRNWNAESWSKLAHAIESKGFKVFEVGLTPTFPEVSSSTHKYVGRRPLEEIASLINGSILFVGIDSSFAHFGNALSKDAVIILGKYRDFSRYCPYSGSYGSGKKALIVWGDEGAPKVSYKRVLSAVGEKLNVRDGSWYSDKDVRS